MVKKLIENENNEKLLSIAIIGQIAIKQSTDKLSLNMLFKEFIEQQISVNNFNLLEIKIDHINVVTTLLLHHRDPFERLLIAQSIVKQIPILSADSTFDAYSINRFW